MNGKKTVISLFAGGGGSSLGYKMAGYTELLAVDFNENACKTLQKNFDCTIICDDITKYNGKTLMKICGIKEGELDILDGSPPCQGFSMAKGKRNVDDPRNTLYMSYVALLKELQPKVFVMENVAGMIKGNMRGYFNQILIDLQDCGYVVKCKKLNAQFYEVPQSRERLFFIGVRKDLKKEPVYPEPIYKIIPVIEALRNCPKDDYDELPPFCDNYAKLWHSIPPGKAANYVVNKGYNNCIKLHPYKPAPTIPKMQLGCGYATICHYEEPRALTISELKRLSTFPDDYVITGINYQEKATIIGNAVMPKQMYHIAKTIKEKIL